VAVTRALSCGLTDGSIGPNPTAGPRCQIVTLGAETLFNESVESVNARSAFSAALSRGK